MASGGVAEQVVAIVEVLSPANKTSFDGREEYRRKQQATLRSSVNLLEIDLLRQGPHTVAVPENSVLNSDGSTAVWDYVVSLHLGAMRHRFRVWPRTVRQPLPVVMLPLIPDRPGVLLDLQSAFDQAYDSGHYRRRIDYSLDPDLGIPAQDADWLDKLLRDKGLRA